MWGRTTSKSSPLALSTLQTFWEFLHVTADRWGKSVTHFVIGRKWLSTFRSVLYCWQVRRQQALCVVSYSWLMLVIFWRLVSVPGKKYFYTLGTSKLAVGATSVRFQRLPTAVSQRVKQQRLEAKHSPACRSGVKPNMHTPIHLRSIVLY